MTLDPTPANIEAFRTWILRRGRAQETARAYCSHVARSSTHAGGMTGRLIDRKLAPKTRHATLAALAAWAKFAKDPDLAEILEEQRLPPAMRVHAKEELKMEAWRSVVRAIDRAKIPEGVRQILLIMALRGLRVGDVLRLQRSEVTSAIATGTLAFEAKGSRRYEYDAASIHDCLVALVKLKDWQVVRQLVGRDDSSDRVINTKVRRALRKCARMVKVADVYPHRLRRTYATHYLKSMGNDPQALIKLTKHMAWTNINTAAGYVDAVNAPELSQRGADLVSDLRKPKK